MKKEFANNLGLFVFLCALLAQALNTWERLVVCVPGSVKLAWPHLNVCAGCIVWPKASVPSRLYIYFFFALFFVHARAVQCVEQDLLSLSQWRVPNHGIACVQQYGRIGSFSFPVACIHVHNLLLSRLFPAASNARLQCSLSRLDGLAQIWAVPAFVVPVEPELCSNSCGLVVLVSLEHMQCHGCLLLRWVHVDTMCGPSLGSWCPVANRITTCWNMCPARAFPSSIWVSL